jgi:hypothetical protein
MNKSKIRLFIMSLLSISIILFIVPQISKKRVLEESNIVLDRNGMEILSNLGDYSYIYQQQDYIVYNRVSGKIDTVGVTQTKGEVMVTHTISFKKEIPKKMFVD